MALLGRRHTGRRGPLGEAKRTHPVLSAMPQFDPRPMLLGLSSFSIARPFEVAQRYLARSTMVFLSWYGTARWPGKMPGTVREQLDVIEAPADRDNALRLTCSRSGIA